jgi:hypothetical protein
MLQALSNAYLKTEGYVRCAMDGSSFTILDETPCADLSVRRFGAGGWGLKTSGYSIIPL